MLAAPRTSMVLAGLVALLASNGFAQGDQEPQAGAAAPAAAPSQTAPPKAPDQAGPGQPPVVVAATDDKATVVVVLRDVKTPPLPIKADFSTGLVTNDQQAALFSRPEIVSFNATLREGSAKDFLVELGIKGLFAFGESSVPLLYRGTLVETLRFARPGLVLKATGDGGFVAREGSKLPLVLDNPTGFGYQSVRARLRFADTDECAFDTELFSGAPGATAGRDEVRKVEKDGKTGNDRQTGAPCAVAANWSEFDVPRYARITLRAKTSPNWFRDPETGRVRGGTKKGLLTLRFRAGLNDPTVFEQNLPLEVRFEPSEKSLLKSLVAVAWFLLLGAGLSLLLRVSVPNIKRKRQLRDALDEMKKHIALISTEVDSDLRVLLRVERLALDEVRQTGVQFGPSYADFARRVEQALPSLNRRIEAVRRLDATLIRRRLMVEQGPAPTRLEQVDMRLNNVSETLKQDSLSEEDWVFVNQRLEGAQKIMRDPSQTESEAFDAMLAQQWKAIREHFDVNDDGVLEVPAALKGMEDCFPQPLLLPKAADSDGSKWVQSVGPVRADLQLYALKLLWEFEFLAPTSGALNPQNRWAQAKSVLNGLLAAPAVNNLREAKSLFRQLAEGVREDDILAALKSGNATIVRDPSPLRANQKIRFSVRFNEGELNSAAARDLVFCRWSFSDRHVSPVSRLDGLKKSGEPPKPVEFSENGWEVHHYFEKDVDQSTISVVFYDSRGQSVDLDNTTWNSLVDEPVSQPRPQEKWARTWLEAFQLSAALLIPLATLASTTLKDGSAGNWWELVAIGFASDTIKSILVGPSTSN